MKKRNPLAVAVLTLLTFGLYAYFWLYQTTDELRRESGRRELSPTVDLLLAILTLGLWGVWAGYRNARIVHELIADRGETEHRDRAVPVALFASVGAFSGWAWPVAMAILQEDYNRAVELDERLSHFDAAVPYEEVVADPFADLTAAATPDGSSRAPARVRVSAAPATPRVRVHAPTVDPIPEGVPVSRWAKAPSAPVFESNAPMPVVY